MTEPNENLLIIFVKNLIPGQVKTRLAKDIGIDGALDVYKYLVEHTNEVTRDLPFAKAIYYSEYVEIEDVWDTEIYHLFVQKGKDLGERMQHAFEQSFEKKFKKVVIIGTDCFDLTPDLIEEAFDELDEHDVVVGPAKDGGYYLLGMKKPWPQLFQGKTYSHKKVFNELLEELDKMKASFYPLPQLSDIDTLQDLKDSSIDFVFVNPDDEDF